MISLSESQTKLFSNHRLNEGWCRLLYIGSKEMLYYIGGSEDSTILLNVYLYKPYLCKVYKESAEYIYLYHRFYSCIRCDTHPEWQTRVHAYELQAEHVMWKGVYIGDIGIRCGSKVCQLWCVVWVRLMAQDWPDFSRTKNYCYYRATCIIVCSWRPKIQYIYFT